MDLILRNETSADYRVVEELTREAFWNVNVPGCDEHYLMHILRDSADFIPALDIVALSGNRVVGNIAYTRSAVLRGDAVACETVTFGPLSVLPQFQRQGVGGALIRHTLALAGKMGFGAVVILGDPAYYSRFGFEAAEKYGIMFENKFAAALQVYELRPGALESVSGVFRDSPAFHYDQAAAEAFDKTFPKKEKLVTPSQARFQEVLKMVH